MEKQPIKEYVLGFAIDPFNNRILLIQKNKPEWQAGKYNGIGGKVEPGEFPTLAMVREFKEETGIKTKNEDWTRAGEMFGNGFFVTVFYTIMVNIDAAKSVTDEPVLKWNLDQIGNQNYHSLLISNLPWLIAFIVDRIHSRNVFTFKVQY